MPSFLPAGIDPDSRLAEQAEEVRAYLVTLRGGAPFLSSADGRLLVGWLTGGVPVPTILSALDRIAEQRRKRQVRTRMTLNAAKKEVERLTGQQASAPEGLAGGGDLAEVIRAWTDEVEAAGAESPFDRPLDALLRGARARAADPGDVETRAALLIGLCREFHEACWQQAGLLREELVLEAKEQLSILREQVSEGVFADLAEESARGRLRARFPLVCAGEVWDRLTRPAAPLEP